MIDEVHHPVLCTSTPPNTSGEPSDYLGELAELVISRACLAGAIYEGIVMTTAGMPYRRLDCDRRALAYIRVRRRKNYVRIDVSGLWRIAGGSRLEINGSQYTLAVHDHEQAIEAALVLQSIVDQTRAFAESRARR